MLPIPLPLPFPLARQVQSVSTFRVQWGFPAFLMRYEHVIRLDASTNAAPLHSPLIPKNTRLPHHLGGSLALLEVRLANGIPAGLLRKHDLEAVKVGRVLGVSCVIEWKIE